MNNNPIQNSADRIAISQRSDNVIFNEQTQHLHSVNINENYEAMKHHGLVGGAVTSNSSKQLINQPKSQKLSSLGREQAYPYQSSSTKSGNQISSTHQKNNLSIAQIFQQKGLSYKGPSKLTISSSNPNSQKLANRMGPNGVIVHTKNGMGVKAGSLTTSANTAQNSPRQIAKHQAMQQMSNSNNASIRKKPSTASMQGTSAQATHKKSASNKFVNQVTNSNLRTTSHGAIFKKMHQQASGQHQESPIMYNDEVEVTEIAHFDNTDKVNEIEPSKIANDNLDMLNNLEDDQINLLPNAGPKRQRATKAATVKSQIVSGPNIGKKQLIIGTQPSTQYIADNGGTGSNPNNTHGLHHRHISQHDFYSQNVQNGKLITNSIP